MESKQTELEELQERVKNLEGLLAEKLIEFVPQDIAPGDIVLLRAPYEGEDSKFRASCKAIEEFGRKLQVKFIAMPRGWDPFILREKE